MEPYGMVLLHICAVQPYLCLHPGQRLFHMSCSSFSPIPQYSSLHLFTCFLTFDLTTCKIQLLPTTPSHAPLQITLNLLFSEDIMVCLAIGTLHILFPLPGMPFSCLG